MIAGAGVESVMLPPRPPNLNAYAERFVRSIKESCVDRMIFFGEESLRTAVQNFVAHYHSERNHQGLANKLIIPELGHLGNTGLPSCVGSIQSGNGRGESDKSNTRTIHGRLS
jgi:transposase InsO family protein